MGTPGPNSSFLGLFANRMVALSLESLGVATALGCIAVLLIPYA